MEQECKETKCLTDAQEHKSIRLLETSEPTQQEPSRTPLSAPVAHYTPPPPQESYGMTYIWIKSQEGEKVFKATFQPLFQTSPWREWMLLAGGKIHKDVLISCSQNGGEAELYFNCKKEMLI